MPRPVILSELEVESLGSPVRSLAGTRGCSLKSIDVMLAMEGGDGDGSYAQNSRVQATAFRFVQPVLEKAIDGMALLPNKLVKIADLGCSSGPNTIAQMSVIVQALRAKFAKAKEFTGMEFQVFFVDLVSNDFNNLFRCMARARHSEVFPTGVAGSFYGRLLPRESLDLLLSSFSLHWLSKIPDEVEESSSPAYNSGRVWIHGGKSEVARAYAKQAKRDMLEFLRSRADEMVSGGLMFLLLVGRKDVDPTRQYDLQDTSMFGMHMEKIFEELISEGFLDAKLRDSFNVPIYHRTVEEMREAVDEVSKFVVDRLELLDDVPGSSSTPEELESSPMDCGRRVARMCRSLLGGLIESHMGVEVANLFFHRLEKRAIERSQMEACKKIVVKVDVNLAILIRK